jgi:hypothetical protein
MGYREVINGEFSHSSRHSNLHQRCVFSPLFILDYELI